jgi:hypothetical protein
MNDLILMQINREALSKQNVHPKADTSGLRVFTYRQFLILFATSAVFTVVAIKLEESVRW